MATGVEFHTGVADVPGYACRLLRKAHAAGARVAVFGPQALLQQVDTALWTVDERGFVPHARWPADAAQAPATVRHAPIQLMAADAPPLHREVALNLGDDRVERFDGFARVIEIVGTDDTAVSAGRARWKAHRAAGREPRAVTAP